MARQFENGRVLGDHTTTDLVDKHFGLGRRGQWNMAADVLCCRAFRSVGDQRFCSFLQRLCSQSRWHRLGVARGTIRMESRDSSRTPRADLCASRPASPSWGGAGSSSSDRATARSRTEGGEPGGLKALRAEPCGIMNRALLYFTNPQLFSSVTLQHGSCGLKHWRTCLKGADS